MAKQRLENIDGLRGLAAISVMIGHWMELLVKFGNLPPALRPFVEDIDLIDFSPGRLGVVTFFCISGLVIPFSFNGKKPLRTFLISRFFRLYPAYWFSLAVGLAILPFLGSDHFGTRQILANITMLQFALKQKDVLGVYWTLFIEIMFYTICFFSFFVGFLHSRWFNLGAVVFFTGIALAGGAYRYTHSASTISIGVFTYLAAMHFGTLTRIVFLEDQQGHGGKRIFGVALAVLLIGTLCANTLGYIHASDKTTGWIASDSSYLVGVALFLLCVRLRWFAQPSLVFLGAASYSLYLIHPVFIELSRYWIAGQGAGVAAGLSALIIVVGSVAVAVAMHKLIERPSIRMGKRLMQSLERRETLAVTG